MSFSLQIQTAADRAQSRRDAAARSEAEATLRATDWYVLRLAETGTPIPAPVLALRVQARAALSAAAPTAAP